MVQDKPESETVPQHQNKAEIDHINKWNNLSQRLFIKLWDLYEELLLVQMENARGTL